jgi:PilZ domain/Putative zinc-finger
MTNELNPRAAALAREIDAHNAERRAEARYLTQDPAEIEILPGPSVLIYGTILDVSRSGLRIALRRRISRGEQVKIKLHRNVIFGEVRYCRAVPDGFQAGVKIQDLVHPPGPQYEHIADDSLSLYAVGKGLSVAEVIEVREHLAQCETCRACLARTQDMLNPSWKLPSRLLHRSHD